MEIQKRKYWTKIYPKKNYISPMVIPKEDEAKALYLWDEKNFGINAIHNKLKHSRKWVKQILRRNGRIKE